MRYSEVAFGVLVVAGLALVAFGLSQPDYVTGIDVEGPVDEESMAGGETVVAYDSLTSAEQRIFDRARNSDGSAKHTPGDWSAQADVVRHDGQYYEVSVWGGENGHRILSIAAGWGISIIGALGFVLSRLLRRVTGGELPLFSS